ncbi:D-2-hydroxyacid dehydrogenase [Chloroflexota bacterium]
MDIINVLIATKLEDTFQRQIADVDRRVKVYDGAGLINAELRRAPQTEVSAKEREELNSLLRDAEVMLMPRVLRELSNQSPKLRDILSRMPKLRWVQYMGVGMERAIEMGLMEGNITVTNASGVRAIPMAEYAIMDMLMLVKKVPLSFLNQQRKHWERLSASDLQGKTAGIIGLGTIGHEVARLAQAFGMRVVATRKSVTRQEDSVMGVDKVYPRKDLLEMLSECDFVVLTAPLTEETNGMLGERELKAMKPGSFLVNISRGSIIDESMLIRALREGWIAGAGLDAFEKEPLNPESELWELPNVIISSHCSGVNDDVVNTEVTRLFCDNLKRYVDGQPLLNVVDKKKGY